VEEEEKGRPPCSEVHLLEGELPKYPGAKKNWQKNLSS
jgi:hypothetical protein